MAKRNPATDIKPSDKLAAGVKNNLARIDSKEQPQLLRRIEAYQGAATTRLVMKIVAQTVGLRHTLHIISGHSARLFPGERDHDKPMSNNTILGVFKRMGHVGRMTGHGFRGVASPCCMNKALTMPISSCN